MIITKEDYFIFYYYTTMELGKPKLSLFAKINAKIKKFLSFGRKTQSDLFTNLQEKSLTNDELKKVIDLEENSTDWEKLDYLKSMLYIAYVRDDVNKFNSMDIPENFALDKINDKLNIPKRNLKGPCPVISQIVRMNSEQMKWHLQEFIKLLKPEQRTDILKVCEESIDTITDTIGDPNKNKDMVDGAKDIAIKFIQDKIIPLFSEQQQVNDIDDWQTPATWVDGGEIKKEAA